VETNKHRHARRRFKILTSHQLFQVVYFDTWFQEPSSEKLKYNQYLCTKWSHYWSNKCYIMKVFTWIFEAVFGSRNDLIVPHNILKPWPALITYIRHNVCNTIPNTLHTLLFG
jgi:hypothetical protein